MNSRRVPTGVVGLIAVAMLAGTPSLEGRAQGQGQGPGQDQGLALGRPEWAAAVRHDTSRPLRDMPTRPGVSGRDDFEVHRGPAIPRGDGPQADAAAQAITVAPMAATPGSGFDGIGKGNSQFNYNVLYAPPDTVGEAGMTQFVQWVNPSFAVFRKSDGALLYGPSAGNTIWTGFGGECEARNDGDPIVQYDQLASRWVMTQFAVRTNAFRQCVAISKTEDATGEWHRYEFAYSAFPDYPKLSIWPDGYYVTFNMFNGKNMRFEGTRVCAYDRSRMLQGLSATQICHQTSSYHSMLAADLDGTTLPPPGTPAYVMTLRSTSSLNLWRFTPNFANGTSTFTGPVAINVAPFSQPSCERTCVPQPGTSQRLDGLADRLMYRLSYRNLGTRASLLVNHSVTASSVIGIRWYEIDITNNSPSVRQQGTYAPNDGHYRWMGSIAMDKMGNIALGYSIGSATLKPSLRFAGRLVTDPPSTMSSEQTMWDGTGSQLANLARWGDYSTMTVDPVDDCTFWFTSEYLKQDGTFNWSTRIGSFKFPNCGSVAPDFTFNAMPSSRTITQGQSTTFDVAVVSANGYIGAGSYSATGLPAGATATFNPTGFSNGSGSSTMTVQTSGSTPTGTYQITVKAEDSTGSPSKSTTVSLTVNSAPVPTFSLGITPTSRTILQGQSTTFSVSTTAQNGYNGSGSFSVTGLPSGASGIFNDGFSGSDTATLTITTASNTPAGTYPLIITATDVANGIAKTVNATLVVNPAVVGDFTVSASPNQLVIKRGKSGNYTVTVATTGGFSEAVNLTVSGLPSGASATWSRTSITGGGTATLTIATTADAPKTTVSVTITGSSSSATRSATVNLKLN